VMRSDSSLSMDESDIRDAEVWRSDAPGGEGSARNVWFWG
jgi:hypothetical protein